MVQRCCYECQHLCVYEGSPEYSEYTPAVPVELQCTKGYFSTDDATECRKSLKDCLEKAGTCPDFVEDLTLGGEDG